MTRFLFFVLNNLSSAFCNFCFDVFVNAGDQNFEVQIFCILVKTAQIFDKKSFL